MSPEGGGVPYPPLGFQDKCLPAQWHMPMGIMESPQQPRVQGLPLAHFADEETEAEGGNGPKLARWKSWDLNPGLYASLVPATEMSFVSPEWDGGPWGPHSLSVEAGEAGPTGKGRVAEESWFAHL